MSAKFWQTFSPVIIDTTKWITFSPVQGTDKLRVVIVIPAFSVDTPFWEGASYITLEFRANFRESFSIIRPVVMPAGADFILAVRSVHDYVDPSNYVLDRWKFWTLNDNPDNLPPWDLYTGQTICKSFALEIWSAIGMRFTSSNQSITLETSVLLPAADCTDDVHEMITIVPVCNLFSELPLVL